MTGWLLGGVMLSALTLRGEVLRSEATVITLVEPGMESALAERLDDNRSAPDYRFYVWPVDDASLQLTADSINQLLNSGRGIDLQFVYVLSVGSLAFQERIKALDAGIFAARVHWSTEASTYVALGWNKADFHSQGLDEVIAHFEGNYAWRFEVDREKSKRGEVVSDSVPAFALGYAFGPSWQRVGRTDAYVPDAYTKHRLSLSRSWNPKWRWNVHLDFGMRRPKVQQIIQDAVLSQVDVGALLGGDEVEVTLDEVFRGHTAFGFSAEVHRTFLEGRQLQPFASVGLGLDVLTSFELFLDTTLTVSSSGVGDFRPPSTASPEAFPRLTFPLGTGLLFHVDKRWTVQSSVTLRPDPSAVREGQPFLHSAYWNVGVRFRLSEPKARKYYRFIQPSSP